MTQVQYLETSKQKELEQALSSGCTDTWQSVSIHGQVLSCVEYIMYLNIIFCVNQVLYSHVDTPASVLLFPVHQVLFSAPIGTHIVSFTHNVRFSVKGLTFHTHCWRKLTLPYLAEVQQIPTSPNCQNIEQTCLNLLKHLTNAPYVQPFIIHDFACTLKRKDKHFLMQRLKVSSMLL